MIDLLKTLNNVILKQLKKIDMVINMNKYILFIKYLMLEILWYYRNVVVCIIIHLSYDSLSSVSPSLHIFIAVSTQY